MQKQTTVEVKVTQKIGSMYQADENARQTKLLTDNLAKILMAYF
jgi:hypothetical protein